MVLTMKIIKQLLIYTNVFRYTVAIVYKVIHHANDLTYLLRKYFSVIPIQIILRII